MDALSEVLRVVRLSSAVFFHARLAAPWSFASPDANSVIRILQPGAERLMIFHLLTEGSCRLEVEGLPPAQAVAGDIIMFPHGDAHVVASGADVPPGPQADLLALLRRGPRELRLGGEGALTRFICGYLTCDPRLCRSILTALPRLVRVNLQAPGVPAWLGPALRYAVDEAGSDSPGGAGVLAKLSELLFVETLRRHVAALPPEQTGWLAGLRDPTVGKSLALLHRDPARSWTVEALAREVHTSRSVLAERFTHYVGQSPMHYLARWRMALAANMLRGSSLSLMRVAEEVGYETDAAFSRAFRREHGVPPAAWRRRHGIQAPPNS